MHCNDVMILFITVIVNMTIKVMITEVMTSMKSPGDMVQLLE